MQLLARLALCPLSAFTLAAAPSFHLNPPQLPNATVGKAYTGGPLMVSGGGQCPRNFTSVRLVAGSLPAGLYLSPAGEFAGAPMETGHFEFVVRVENGCGWSDQPLSMEVSGAPIILANPAALQFRVLPGQPITPGILQVSGNMPGTTYTVATTAPWIRARAHAGRIPAGGSAFSADLVEVEIDSASLGTGVHRGLIEIGAWRAGNAASVPVEVEVLTAAGTSPSAVRSWAQPNLREETTPRLVLPAPPHQREAAHVGEGPVHGGGAHAVPAHTSKAAQPKRMSRSAQLRSKYLASKPAAVVAPAKPAPAAAPAADPHAKPSPVEGHKAPASGGGHAAAPAKKDDHGAAAAKKDDHGAPPKKEDAHGAAKKNDHAPAAPKKDDHGAKKDSHGAPAKKDDGHKEKPKH